MDFHRSAFKHDIDVDSIRHALDHAITVVDLDPDADPPKVLAIGADAAGNLLEIIWLQLDGEDLVIHAMRLRPAFYDLLLPADEETT